MEIYKAQHPLSFIRAHVYIENSLRKLYFKALGFNIKYPLKSFIIPKDLQNILKKIKGEDYPKTLQIIGKTGTGKTAFIIAYLINEGFSFFRACNLDGLRFYNGQDVIVFDDFDWGNTSIDREKALHLLDNQMDATISIKHTSANLPQGPRFIITNKPLEKYDPIKGDIYQRLFTDQVTGKDVTMYNLTEIRGRSKHIQSNSTLK